MENLQYLLHGFSSALQPMHLVYLFIGVTAGTLVGLLPAIGPTASIALLLPTAYHMDPLDAIIMLAGISYGSQYGGSTTSILINVPGEASSVATCFDGYPMARQGRAGAALGISAFGSFIAGTFGVVGLMLFAPALGRMALNFGSPEYFSLMVMSLAIVTYMVRGSMMKALMMVAWGLILSTVGVDFVTAKFRFTFDTSYLQDGIPIVPVSIGLFGLREVFNNFEITFRGELLKEKVTGLLPTRQDWKDSFPPILRGSVMDFFMGILPGITPLIPTFVSYGIERRLSKHPERFGKGAIEGVAGPEAANNATVCGAQVPLYSLGIPTNTVGSMMLAALIIFGMMPGPRFIETSPDFFWGLIASMYLGNVLCVILNLPLIPLWVKVLKVPFVLLNILIMIFCIIGTYSIKQEIADVYVTVVFGVVGILAKKFGYEPGPLILAFILGPMIENALRQSLIFSSGSFTIFLTRPISAVCLAVAVLIIVTAIIFHKKKTGDHVEATEEY